MKVDYIKVDGEMGILIRDINATIFNMGALNVDHIVTVDPFTDPYKIADEIRRVRKIGAIKEVRFQTGWGLKDSKHYVDRYMPVNTLPEGFDYHVAADRFVSDHIRKPLEGVFLSNDEMKIE
jgi:hypothetical protein